MILLRVPPLISVVVNTLLGIVIIPVELAIVADDIPSLDFILVTSILVVSIVVELTVVILPIVDPKVVIVVALIVPPSTLSPLIWLSANVKVPSDISNVLPEPTVILLVAIVVPSIVPPFISTVVTLPKSAIVVPLNVEFFPKIICSLSSVVTNFK